jgi:hypothetical protein
VSGLPECAALQSKRPDAATFAVLGSAHRVGLVDHPSHRGVRLLGKRPQVRKPGVETGCGGIRHLNERWKRALDHRGCVRNLTDDVIAGVGEPTLAGIDRREPGLGEPPSDARAGVLRPLASIAPATAANNASKASLVGDAHTEL